MTTTENKTARESVRVWADRVALEGARYADGGDIFPLKEAIYALKLAIGKAASS
jgi:hypothetical protein